MDKEKLKKAVKLSESIEWQKERLALIECLRKEHRATDRVLHITDHNYYHTIPDELEAPILDLLTDYHSNILSELEKEFEEL